MTGRTTGQIGSPKSHSKRGSCVGRLAVPPRRRLRADLPPVDASLTRAQRTHLYLSASANTVYPDLSDVLTKLDIVRPRWLLLASIHHDHFFRGLSQHSQEKALHSIAALYPCWLGSKVNVSQSEMANHLYT